MGQLMYRLYIMYLAVMLGDGFVSHGDAGAGPSIFAAARRRPPDMPQGYPGGS